PHESLRKLAAWEESLDEQIGRLESRQIEIRRHLHAHPEPSREEIETSRYVAACLTSAGLQARIARDGLGVVADCDLGRCDDDSPRIALRADLDALRIQDAKQTPYASQNPGLCHACGHDAHTSIVLGAALCCAELNRACQGGDDSPSARLRFIFQPAEESAEGARWMVEQGAVDDVDTILAVHVDPERQLGTVGIRYGTLTANCDEIGIIIEGKGGHSARPHHTRDPIAAAAHLINALYEFLPRSVDSRNPSVFSVGKVAGGTLPNVIPDRVEILGSLRTIDSATRTRLKDRIEEIVHGAKETSGTSIHLRFFESIDAVYNDPRVTSALEEASRRVIGGENIQYIDHASMGGEDFSAYLSRVPGAMIRLGCAPPGFTAPFLHAPDFDIDERTLAVGTRILLRAALLLAASPRHTPPTGQVQK
ncbi:MAG: M20 family metallopeptidase, partial [Maioricimonas sp. JB049]